MGKYRKVQIDDRMPCTEHEELWPCILTKAIVKLLYFKINKKSYIKGKIGDGAILHALLGYTTENIDLETNFTNNKTLLSRIYTENYYLNKNKYVLCYNNRQALDRINNNTMMKLESHLTAKLL